MISRSSVARAMSAGIVLLLLLLLAAAFSGQGASAARVNDGGDPPRTFLVKLDQAPTIRAFRANRSGGLGAARSAARRQKSIVDRSQERVIRDLPVDADVLYRTHSVLAAVAVTAPESDQEALEEIPGVAAVYPVATKRISNASAMPLQAAPVAWQSTGFLGQGQTIAVIDTGLDYTHSSFGGSGTPSDYQAAHAAEDQPVNPALIDPTKFVGGIDLVGDTYNPSDPGSPGYQPVPHPDPNPLDCDGHGSHVAGSAAGFGVKADGSTYDGSYDESTDFGAMKIGPGMAPEAGIYAIKVFGCGGGTNVVAQAIDRAVDPNNDGDPSDRVDVINLSLGSDFGSAEDGDSVAANAAVAMGVSVVAAAGNAGDVTDISGSPGDAARVLSVASTVDAQSIVDGAQVSIDGDTELHAVTRSGLYDWGSGPDLAGEVVIAPPTNETACTPYGGTPFTGKVVLVKWHDESPECGSITRGSNLAAAGAVGFIFGSDSESFSSGINGSATIPGVLMAASGAEAIRAGIDGSLEVTVAGTQINAVTQNFPEDVDKASGFTSRGIHAEGNVKPDVAAVGSSVFSVAVGTGEEGTSNSGTSMASPMVAGLAALVHQAHPDWTPLQVKADIMNTARHDVYVDGSSNPSSDRYGPPRVGSGRIDAAGATENEVLAYNPVNGSVSVSFGPVAASGPLTLSRAVTVDNQSSGPVTYDVSYDPINEVPGAEIKVASDQVTVGAGETASVTVELEISDPTKLTKAVDPTAGRLGVFDDPLETLAEAFGRVLLEPTSPGIELRVPVYASPRPASTMTQPDSIEIHRTSATAGSRLQTGTLELSGSGVGTNPGDNGIGDGDPDNDIQSIAAGFEHLANSGESPQCGGPITLGCWRLPEERNADVSMIGFTSTAPLVGNPANGRGLFAIAVHEPWAIPSDKVHLQIGFDTDSDDEPDLFLFNSRYGDEDIFVSVLFDPAKPAAQRVIDLQLINGRFGDLDTALYDSDVMVLPVSLGALATYGINPNNPRVRFGVETYTGFSHQPIDLIGVDPNSGDLADPLSVDLFTPGIMVTRANGSGPLLQDQPGEKLVVKRDLDSFAANGGLGVMMVHFHNQVGEKAQAVSLRRASSVTKASIVSGKLKAEVGATKSGMPVPTGEVVFRVGQSQVGSATLENGIATISHTLPQGVAPQVAAEYQGDVDFEPSQGEVGRSTPKITARITSNARKNARGWYRKPVTVRFRCVGSGSPITRCPAARKLAKDGRNMKVSGTAVAADGGAASVRVRGIKIDRTRPVVRIRGIRAGASYRRVKRARCVVRDRTSGVLRCRVKVRRRGNTAVYVARASDRAGNRRTVRLQVRIRR